MKNPKLIFRSLAGLLFVAFTAANVTVSHSYNANQGVPEFTLFELNVQAQSGEECEYEKGQCYNGCFAKDVSTSNNYYYGYNWSDCRAVCETGGTDCCITHLINCNAL